VFYASTRNSITALYTATRTAIGATWTTPTVVTDFGLAGEQDPWMSPDQRTFIFASDSAGTNDIYISTR
jgi:Tol biopolymer transport system component